MGHSRGFSRWIGALTGWAARSRPPRCPLRLAVARLGFAPAATIRRAVAAVSLLAGQPPYRAADPPPGAP